uniref:Uncharacterized protein n=1 Tax=Schistocephalus solidus TaxID=70667 RepID=A0A0X3PKD6_SCHSO
MSLNFALFLLQQRRLSLLPFFYFFLILFLNTPPVQPATMDRLWSNRLNLDEVQTEEEYAEHLLLVEDDPVNEEIQEPELAASPLAPTGWGRRRAQERRKCSGRDRETARVPIGVLGRPVLA